MVMVVIVVVAGARDDRHRGRKSAEDRESALPVHIRVDVVRVDERRTSAAASKTHIYTREENRAHVWRED